MGHKGIFSLKNHSARLNPLSNWCTPAKSRPAEDAHIYARNHQNVGRDWNKPLTLQSAIANASFGKTSSVSASDKRYASLANKPYNLWANVDNFTRESGGRDYAGAKVDSDQDYKSLISWVFVKRLFSAPGCVQPAEITSDKIKLKYTSISAPICFCRLLSFPNIFLCWALSPQPHSPHTTFCRTALDGGRPGLASSACFVGGHLPHSGDSYPGTERKAPGIWIARGPAWSHKVPASKHFASLCWSQEKWSGRGSRGVRKCWGSVKLHGKCERTGTALLKNHS